MKNSMRLTMDTRKYTKKQIKEGIKKLSEQLDIDVLTVYVADNRILYSEYDGISVAKHIIRNVDEFINNGYIPENDEVIDML